MAGHHRGHVSTKSAWPAVELMTSDMTCDDAGQSTVPGGTRYNRLVVRTRWLTADDDLTGILHMAVERYAQEGDTLFISEKAILLLTGGTIPTADVHPGRLAHWLCRHVRPRPGSRGLSLPVKMQYVLDDTGAPRILLAALASAVSRPFGLRGMFYRVAGSVARDLDGGRPPYEEWLFPPLPPGQGELLCSRLAASLGVPVAIVDLNDFGGTIRARSAGALPAGVLLAALRDNPLGQRDKGRPFGFIRRADGAAATS